MGINRPNMIGSKYFFTSSINTLTVTNTIMDAVDSAISSTDIYPQAYTATLNEIRDERNVRSVATDVDLAAASRIAFGLFLGDEFGTKGNVLYSCKGSIQFFAEASNELRILPIIGQCDASTVTSSTAAASNVLATYSIIPELTASPYAGSSAITRQKCAVDYEFIKIGSGSTDPMCFAFVIENLSAGTAYNIDQLQLSMTFQKYVADTSVWTSLGR